MAPKQSLVPTYFERDEWKPLYRWERAEILKSLLHLNQAQLIFLKRWAYYYVHYRDHPRDPQNVKFWWAMDNIANRFFSEVGPEHRHSWRRAKIQFYKRWLKRHLIARWDARTKDGKGLSKLIRMGRAAVPTSTPAGSRESSPVCVIRRERIHVTI
ncbi:hypothetical protein VNI00_017729 [Paramarasmius palmivorus]|uniref:Uncharacterized protein n=1 Tax=Paramarasmius palmivorus TaxID=297713 RepID=A0AAW0B6R6_9AGAR